MPQGSIRLQFQLSRFDFCFSGFFLFSLSTLGAFLLWGLYQILDRYFLLKDNATMNLGIVENIVLFSVVAGFVLLFIWSLQFWLPWNRYLFESNVWEISDKEIFRETETIQEQIPWDIFNSATENKIHFILEGKGRRWYRLVFPKKYFSQEKEMLKFRQLLKDKKLLPN